jgi:hypothetical protein
MAGGSPDSIALYLLEPQTCDYILGIESPFICLLLNNVDEHGLIAKKGVVNNADLLEKQDKELDEFFKKIMDKLNNPANQEEDEEETPGNVKRKAKSPGVRDEL